MPFIANKSWPEIRSRITTGSKGFFVEQETGWIQVVIPDERMDCEFPNETEFDLLPPTLQRFYERGWAEEFRQKYKHILITSSEGHR